MDFKRLLFSLAGITLWDHNDLEENTRDRPKPNSDFEIVATESIQDKSSALNVEASLKASFLSGLVEVDGSAKYLNDHKMSKRQARVTLNYKATTKFQELSMNHLGRGNMKHSYVFDQGLATHVVTGILYGAQAFFVFDREVSKVEDHRDIEGNLKAIIKKIPHFAIEGSLKMEDREKASVEKFSCKFFGDFCLSITPTSFQDAVEVYQSLPTLLGANGENAVPVKVWLLPLTTLDSSAAKLVRQISIRLVQESQSFLEDFRELNMRCNDALKTKTAQQFPQIGKKIKTFREMCSEFRQGFQQTLAKKLQSIRQGVEEESVLAEALKERQSSPFNSISLNEWMDCKEREICMVKSFTNMMRNTRIVPSPGDLNRDILNVEQALCFVFTSLGSVEPYLSVLSNYLTQTVKPDEHLDIEKEQWYMSAGVADTMRRSAKLFSVFAEANKDQKVLFLTVGLSDETHKGSSIYYYKGGFAVSHNFELPSKPESITVGDIKHDSVTLKIPPPEFGAENVTSYLVEYQESGEDGWKRKTESEAGKVTVNELSPNTEYTFRCRTVTSVGVGPASVSAPIRTSRCNTLAEAIKEKSALVTVQPGPLPVYKVPLEEERVEVPGCRLFHLGNESTKRNRTIVMFGAAGSGKSAVISWMINYILGVEWGQSFRFHLVDEDQSHAESQTSAVKVYKFNHQQGFKVNYSLTIIDIPDLGEDIETDMTVQKQLRNLFSAPLSVSHVDAVCFVTQAAVARLTWYVFDFGLSMFGKDVADNFRILVTFTDAELPSVLHEINASGVPCLRAADGLPVYFRFNNSALFSQNASSAADRMIQDESDEDQDLAEMFWRMGTKTLKRFFVALDSSQTKGVKMTMEVLEQRERLETFTEKVKNQVKVGLAKLQEIQEKTKNFSSGDTRFLPMQKAFRLSVLTERLNAEYGAIHDEVVKLTKFSRGSLNRLKETELKSNPLYTPEYIDMLIKVEKSEAKRGCQERLTSLMAARETAECITKIQRGEALLQSPASRHR